MPATPAVFDIDDAKLFQENLDAFLESLKADDPGLAAVFSAELPKLARGEITATALYDALAKALKDNAP
jgi:hypothetical protein